MRVKEYFELARRMMKINKASNKSIVRGLIIGFSLLIPVITLLLCVNVSISKYIDNNPYLINFETTTADYRIPTLDEGEKKGNLHWKNISGNNHIDYITDNANITRSLIYESCDFNDYFNNDEPPMKFAIGNNKLTDIAFRKAAFANIIDVDKSDSFFPKNYTENFPGGIYLSGYDKGFDGNGKQQVILSERFLADNNLMPESVYLNTLTVKSNNKVYLKEGYLPVEGFLCKNYTVVGIIRTEVAENSPEYGFMGAQMFFTSASVYDENGIPMLKPYMKEKKDYGFYRVYDNWDNREALNEEYMMLGWKFTNGRFLNNGTQTFSQTCIYAEADSYNELSYQHNALNKRFSNALGFSVEFTKTSELFESYPMLKNISNIAGYLLLTVGVAIGFSALINMFSSINHSVRTRAQYLTMMRAIGARDKDIPRLYMAESALLSLKTCAITGVLGLLLGTAIKLIYEERQDVVYHHQYVLNMPWHVIILVPIITVICIFLVNIFYSYIASRRLSKKNIVSIINNG